MSCANWIISKVEEYSNAVRILRERVHTREGGERGSISSS